MATYLELHKFFTDDSDLRKRTQVAVIMAVEDIRAGSDTAANGWNENPDYATSHAKRVTWAQSAVIENGVTARSALKLMLAANASASVAQIEGASDAALQSNVRDAVDFLAGA